MEETKVERSGFAVQVQKFGRFLSGMVMPNIGAFIAWGLITALFIETGWLPNENFASLVDPMILFLLPILIGIPVEKWYTTFVEAWSGPLPR